MKKVLFTAIAMVAFSSVSMANTAEQHEKIIYPKEKEKSQLKIIKKPVGECLVLFAQIYQAYLPVLGKEQAYNIADGAYDACISYPTIY